MDLREITEKRVDVKIKFQENLYNYLIVNTIISIICFVFLQSFWLQACVIFFWSISVLDGFFNTCSLMDYKEKMVQRELSKIGE